MSSVIIVVFGPLGGRWGLGGHDHLGVDKLLVGDAHHLRGVHKAGGFPRTGGGWGGRLNLHGPVLDQAVVLGG